MTSRFFSFLFILSLTACATTGSHSVHNGRKPPPKISDKETSTYYFILSELEKYEGHSDESASYLDRALKKNPTSSYLITNKAYDYARQDKVPEALKLAQEAIKNNPNDAGLNLLLGKLYSTIKDREQAQIYYEKSLALNPSNEEVYTFLAQEYIEQGNTDQAIKLLNKLTVINPSALSAYFYLGAIYTTAIKDLDRALSAYQSFLDIDSDNPKVLELVANIYLQKKDYKNALNVFEKMKELMPQDVSINTRIALLYYEMKETDQAIKIFEDLLQKNPKADRVIYYLGLLYQEQEENQKALSYFSKVPASSSFYNDSILRQVVILKNTDQFDKATNLAKEVMMANPLVPDFYDILSSLYVSKKNYSSALIILNQALEKLPRNEHLLFASAVVYEKSGEWEKSIVAMKKVIEVNPKNASALNFVGYTYAEHKQNLDEALILVKQASALSPNDGYILDSLGWVLFLKGESVEAQRILENANKLRPNEATILEHLGDVSLSKQDKRSARKYYEQALFSLSKKNELEEDDEKQKQSLIEKIGGL